LVATTDLHSERPVIWDMDLIAMTAFQDEGVGELRMDQAIKCSGL
jgi:hypothetical protein